MSGALESRKRQEHTRMGTRSRSPVLEESRWDGRVREQPEVVILLVNLQERTSASVLKRLRKGSFAWTNFAVEEVLGKLETDGD